MMVNTKTMVSITEANQNFSRVTKIADRKGQAVIFKNNKPKYLLIDIENNPVIEDNSYIDNQQTIEPVMEPEINEPQVAPVQNQFFNVDIPSSNNEVTESVAPVIEEPVVQENTTVNNVEPIPAMSGDNVVDPVSYFDTLDPQFIDKIKESEGLDLKTAINEYRSVTAILNSRGFNISIDEADEPEKYHIVIDIDKQ